MAPLSHIRVLDFTQFLAGPYSTQILADLGAEVIKIEAPQGDFSRQMTPHTGEGESIYFLCINRNKQSVTVDMRKPEGKALVLRLLAHCDVVMENFRPGVMQRLGFDYQALSQQHPKLIWCSISGFGQNGPYRDRPAYDMIVQAMSGGMSLTGETDGNAVRTGVPLGDLAAGMYGAIGVLAAIAQRDVTGQGQYIDVAMLDCQIAMLNYHAAYYLAGGKVPGRQGRGHDLIPTYRCFAARDGREVVVTCNTDTMWKSMCDVLGVPELADDPRFRSNPDRQRHRTELAPLLERAFLARDADDWVARLLHVGVPVATVNTVDRALADPHVNHRGMVVELKGERPAQQVRVTGNPVKMAGLDAPSYPPANGEDTREVLRDLLDLSDGDIDELLRRGVIAQAGEAPAAVKQTG